MSIEGIAQALRTDASLSPMARLTLVALGDLVRPAEPFVAETAEGIACRIRQRPALVPPALTELADAHVIWVDRQDTWPLRPDAMVIWLTWSPGWEHAWEERLWAQNASSRPAIPGWLRQAVYERDGRVCASCGSTARLSIDHVHPVSRGGLTVLANLAVLCRRCNSIKSNRLGVAA